MADKFFSLEMLGGASMDLAKEEEENPLSEEQILDCSESLLSLSNEGTRSLSNSTERKDETDTKTNELESKNLENERSAYCSGCGKVVYYEKIAKEHKLSNTPLLGDSKFQILWCPSCKPIETSIVLNINFLSRSWYDIAAIALENLHISSGYKKYVFRYREDICKFISKHWDVLAGNKNKKTAWESTLSSSMNRHEELFLAIKLPSGSRLWYLKKNKDIPQLQEQLKEYTTKISGKKRKRPNSKDRITNKKPKLKQGDNVGSPVVQPEIPLYPLFYPPKFYSPTSKIPLKMIMISENSARQIKILNEGLTCYNQTGYRMARGSYPIEKPGVYYYEVSLPNDLKGNVRIGWSTEKGDLQGPVGYDRYSFSYRNATGQVFYRARGKNYGESYGAGDTIGLMIKTTEEKEERDVIFELPKKKISKWAKETTIYSKKTDESLKQNIMIGSEIIFFKNGISQGVAFTDIEEGNYYPAVSLFMGAQCDLNFGPDFKFPIKEDHKYFKDVAPLCSVVPKEHPKEESPVPIPGYPYIPGTIPVTNPTPTQPLETANPLPTSTIPPESKPITPHPEENKIVTSFAPSPIVENKMPSISVQQTPIIQQEVNKMPSISNPTPVKVNKMPSIENMIIPETPQINNIPSVPTMPNIESNTSSVPLTSLLNNTSEPPKLPPITSVQALINPSNTTSNPNTFTGPNR